MNKKNFKQNKNSMSKKLIYKDKNKIYILATLLIIIITLFILIYFNYLTHTRLDLLSTNLENLTRQQVEFNEKLLEYVRNSQKNEENLPIKTVGILETIKNVTIEIILSFLEIIFT